MNFYLEKGGRRRRREGEEREGREQDQEGHRIGDQVCSDSGKPDPQERNPLASAICD